MIKERVELLHQEFNIPIWVTEFDWNGDESVEFGDHSRHAEIVENFYRLMFSLEVSLCFSFIRLNFEPQFPRVHFWTQGSFEITKNEHL